MEEMSQEASAVGLKFFFLILEIELQILYLLGRCYAAELFPWSRPELIIPKMLTYRRSEASEILLNLLLQCAISIVLCGPTNQINFLRLLVHC